MLPYSATDMLNVMRYEQMTDEERRYGARIARDIATDDIHRDDHDRHDGWRLMPLRLAFLRGLALARSG
jgi:hypothetical protein